LIIRDAGTERDAIGRAGGYAIVVALGMGPYSVWW